MLKAQPRVHSRVAASNPIDGCRRAGFDDAFYCEPRPRGGYRLLVAMPMCRTIAPGSALDDEALNIAATLMYFPDHVVPMLPKSCPNGFVLTEPEVIACACGRYDESALRQHQYYTFYQR